MTRPLHGTLRFLAVAFVAAATLALRAVAEEDADPAADLRLAGRSDADLAARLAAARRLGGAGRVPDPDRALFVAADLLRADAAVAGALARAALDSGPARDDARAALAAAAAAREALEPPADPSDLAAVRLLLGDRARAAEAFDPWPPSAFVLGVLRRDAPELPWTATAPDRAAWDRHARVAALLDAAEADDPALAGPAMTALRTSGDDGVSLLAATARRDEVLAAPGLVARRARAVACLGATGDRRATEALVAALSDREHGWVRLAAACALGDLGDPAAAPALARTLFYLGDAHRPLDSWDYPGVGNTDVPPEAWAEVEYYTVDTAVCDALLRLGVRDAAAWLLRQRLDPRSGRWRVRALHDAGDAIARSFPDAPRGYEADAGLPERQKAHDALQAWWAKGPRLARPLDEADPRWRGEARRLAAEVGGRGVSVMNLQIAKNACALLGPPMTPAVLETLAASRSRVQRAELAVVLGTLRDLRAVGPLLELTRDAVPTVRANAAEALAAYGDPPEPAHLANAAPGALDAAVARWIEMLGDPEAAPRASAMRALASAPARADVRAAVEANSSARRPENSFFDFATAERVAWLVQTGEGLDQVVAGLDDPVLVHRRTLWELLRAALRLDSGLWDPLPDPRAPDRRAIDRRALEAALARRRAQ